MTTARGFDRRDEERARLYIATPPGPGDAQIGREIVAQLLTRIGQLTAQRGAQRGALHLLVETTADGLAYRTEADAPRVLVPLAIRRELAATLAGVRRPGVPSPPPHRPRAPERRTRR
jgi:hypothetical protein